MRRVARETMEAIAGKQGIERAGLVFRLPSSRYWAAWLLSGRFADSASGHVPAKGGITVPACRGGCTGRISRARSCSPVRDGQPPWCLPMRWL